MSANPKTVLVFSGGMDSTTLLYQLHRESHELFALGINYGQRHQVELDYARALAKKLAVPFEVADLSPITRLISNSSQTDRSIPVPIGHYSAENMKATVVPNRNMIMLAVAAGWAINLKANHVAYAAHGGDHAIYPDCRSEFADAVGTAIGLSDWHQVSLIRPFVALSKADIAILGRDLCVPFEETWSCYEGGKVHCGACGTCIERRESFIIAGMSDPTRYSDLAPMLCVKRGSASAIDWSRTIDGNAMPMTPQQEESES